MTARKPSAFHTGLNMYVPNMQYAADIVGDQPSAFSLGSPAVASINNIAAAIVGNAVALTEEAYAVTLDAVYGRTLQVSVSGDPGAATSVVDIYGFDYLRQPMIERFTTLNGSTAIQWGQKAFKYIQKSRIITAATNAITIRVGTGTRLGLPYKGDIEWAKENGVLVPLNKRDLVLANDRPAALAVAGGSVFVRAPCPGYVKSLRGYTYGAGSTNDPVITVKLATVAIVGLTVTLDANVSTTAAVVTGVPTTAGYNANNRCVTGDVIEIVGTAAAAAAGDHVEVLFSPTQFSLPDLTDAATRITGDTRGTYDPILAPGGTEVIVGLMGDPAANASNNGGLHGIRQFYG